MGGPHGPQQRPGGLVAATRIGHAIGKLRKTGALQFVIDFKGIASPAAGEEAPVARVTASAGAGQVELLQASIAQSVKFNPLEGVRDALSWYDQRLRQSTQPLVVAPETAVPPLPPSESEFRFQLTFQNLVLALNRLGSTLIVFMGFMIALVVAIPGFTPAQLMSTLGLGSLAIGFAFKDIVQKDRKSVV